jgi:hypothetical protein
MALVPPPTLPPAAKWGVAVHPPHGRRLRREQVRRIRSVPCAAGHAAPTPPWGLYKTSYAVEVAATFLDGLVLTPQEGRGEDLSARAEASVVVGKPPVQRWPLSSVLRWSPPLAGLPVAEVVAAAGEAAQCRGGCLRWRDHQRHLPPSLQLFGFNGLVVAPRRRTGARTSSQWRTH